MTAATMSNTATRAKEPVRLMPPVLALFFCAEGEGDGSGEAMVVLGAADTVGAGEDVTVGVAGGVTVWLAG